MSNYSINYFEFKDIDERGDKLNDGLYWLVDAANALEAIKRFIAGMCKALLIPEAGLPSGTFITADRALDYGREVWAIPGPIDSPQSKGTNKLIAEGATCIHDSDSLGDAIRSVFRSKQA